MLSSYDLTEELTALARQYEFEQKANLQTLKGHVICISGTFFISKVMEQVQAGDLLTGISIKSVKAHIEKFKKDADAAGIKFKLIFNGPETYFDANNYNNACHIRRKFFHLLWKLEVMKSLASQNQDSTEFKEFLGTINRVKRITKDSYFFKCFLERETMELIFDYLYELEVEFFIAPGKANNQLVWLYSYDYCEAVVGDLSLLPFAETLPQIITDINFDAQTFSYINMKDFSEGLKLVRGKEKRQAELWAFTVPQEALTDADINLLVILDEQIKNVENRKEQLTQERSKKVYSYLETINSVLSQLDCNALNTDKQYSEVFSKVTEGKFPKREANLFRLDNYQVIQSSCEFGLYPATKTLAISEPEKQKIKAASVIEFSAHVSKCLYSFMSFDIFNSQFLLMTTKASKYHIYFSPPISDSKEYRNILESIVPKDLEVSFCNFCSVFGKLFLIQDYAIETYFNKETVPLNMKDYFQTLDSGEKVFYYFKEAAFQRFEKDNGSSKANQASQKISFKNLTTMVFQALSIAPESSPLVVSTFIAKKNANGDLNLSRREILSFVLLNLLDDLEFISLKQKKFLILGAALMRKGSDVMEEKLILLLEMIKLNLMSGEFMNPPEMSLLKNYKKQQDKYLTNSLRKTSEEIRTKAKLQLSAREDVADAATNQRRKESEFLLHFDEILNREPTIYDYEKIVNVITTTVGQYKRRFEKLLAASKVTTEEAPELFVSGLTDKSVNKIVAISRVFCLIDGDLKLKDENNFDYLQDFDTSQFLSVLGLTQRNLRFKVEGFFSVAVNLGSKSLLLKDIEDIKNVLPFRTSFNGHLSNICKHIVTLFVLHKQASKASPTSELCKVIEADFNFAAIQERYPNYGNLKESLTAGYHILVHLVKLLEYGMERGIEKQSSPVIQLWLDCRDLLKECFTQLGVLDSLPKTN